MSDLSARVRYEVRMVDGPSEFVIRGVSFILKANESAFVVVRVTTMREVDIEVKTVGVIGDQYASSSHEGMNLARYMSFGGVIVLNDTLNIAPSTQPGPSDLGRR